MAIIVNKDEKRQSIALACKDLVVKNGIHSLSVATLAKEAGIGKGTIYEYFSNKEEIVFEIANILMQKNIEKLVLELEHISSTKDKIKKFSEFFYNDEDYELRSIYKNFIALSLSNKDKELMEFQTKCSAQYYDWVCQIIQEGIDKNELKKESIKLARGLFVVGKGMFILSEITDNIENLQKELNNFIDSLFLLMECEK